MPSYLWLIPALPIVGLLLIVVATMGRPRLSGVIAILAIGAAFVTSLLALAAAIGRDAAAWPAVVSFPWYTVGPTTLSLGAIFDPLAASMLVVVTLVSLLVQVYSQGY